MQLIQNIIQKKIMNLNLINKKNALALLVGSILFLNFTYSQNSDNWKSINKEKYTIEYPEEWQLNTSGQMNTTFIIFSKLEQNDRFRENVNLMIQDLTGMNLDLKGYTELSAKQIKATQNSEIFESKDLKKDGLTYHQIVWKGFVAGKNLKFKQLYFVENNKAYLITLTCDEQEYDDYNTIGTKILNSFTLK